MAVGDYRALNRETITDNYPVPTYIIYMKYLSYTLQGKNFCKIDLKKVYYEITIPEDDISKTVVSKLFGLYEFICMPFGLLNSGQRFHDFMHRVLEVLDYCFIYIDDTLVASENQLQHKNQLRTNLERLDKFGLLLNILNQP